MIEDTDLIFKRTKQDAIDIIYDIFQVIHNLFNEAGIEYSLCAGSLLGAVRHKGLIPWDDDGDIMILESDLSKVELLKPKFLLADLNITVQHLYIGDEWISLEDAYKISSKKGIPVTHDYACFYYPAVDIFPLRNDADNILVHKNPIAQELWPTEVVPFDAWSQITETHFGHLKLSCLPQVDAEKYLDMAYGENWRNTAYQQWDHKLEVPLKKREVLITDFSHAKKVNSQFNNRHGT